MNPDVTQPWYADDAGALGMFDHLEHYFKSLRRNGPEWGYIPEPTKSIIDMHTQNLESGEEFRQRHGFKVCIGARYIGGYIGDKKPKGDWLKDLKEKWERDICALRKTANKCPQESYAPVDHVVQLEWIFRQCMTKETVKAFRVLGEVLWENFLPHIFFGN